MKTSVKKLPKSQIEISFEISPEELEEYYQKAVLNLSKSVKMDGFRPGKIPSEIIEKGVNEGVILEEAAELAVKDKYVQFLLQEKIEVLGQPEIQVLKLARSNPFEFRAKAWVLPEVILPDYKSITSEIKRKEVKVEEKEVREAMIWLQKSRAEFNPKNSLCQKNDFVEISYYSPQIENKREFQDKFILGEGHFIRGFEENIIGMSAGGEKEFSIDFPKSTINPELSDKKVDFRVKVITIQEMKLPEMTDDWAKSLGGFENIEHLKKSIREGITQEKKMVELQRLRAEIIEKITKETKIEMPEILVNSEKDKMLSEFKERVHHDFQISFEDYLKRMNKTEKDVSDSFENEAQNRVKNFLVLREIGRKENIQVSEEEISQGINATLRRYSDAKKAKNELDLSKAKIYTEGELKNEKVFQILEGFVAK